MRHRAEPRSPAVEIGQQRPQGLALLGLELLGLDHHLRGRHQGQAALAADIVQQLQRGIAEAALGRIDDALEGEVVVGLGDAAQVGQRVADLEPLVEARAADHPIGQPERDEALLELAHLERGAHQDRDLVERLALALQLLDLLADRARLLLGVPHAGDGRLLAGFAFGEQRLAEPVLVVGDQPRGGAQDMAGRAVVVLEPHHRGAGKIVLEAQDVVDLGAAPAVDRLVVVADAAEVVPALRQQPQPQVLDHVGVLVLVDQHVPEAVLVLRQHVRVLAEQPQAFEQQVAEIGGVEDLQPLLIGGVELLPLAVGEGAGLAGRHAGGIEAAVLPAVDEVREAARRPALVVDVLGLQHLLEQADLVVGVEDGEARLQADQFGVAAQDLGADRVEGAEPGHALGHRSRPGRAMRSFISRAALLVKVTARISCGRAWPVARMWAMRVVSTRVLPVPAPASTSTGPSMRLDGPALFRVEPVEIRAPQSAARARSAMPPGRGARETAGSAKAGLPSTAASWRACFSSRT